MNFKKKRSKKIGTSNFFSLCYRKKKSKIFKKKRFNRQWNYRFTGYSYPVCFGKKKI